MTDGTLPFKPKWESETLAFEVIRPQCEGCAHYLGLGICVAFPEGIPLQIMSNSFNHQAPFPGDNGIQYLAIEDADPDQPISL